MTKFAEQAVDRIKDFLKHYDTDKPAEIIADILHYCQDTDIDFDGEVELAKAYVAEELSYDAEMAG